MQHTQNIQEKINRWLSTNDIQDHKYRTKDLLDISTEIYNLEINNIDTFETPDYIIYKHYVQVGDDVSRSYLIKIPKTCNLSNVKKCIMFFHGSRDLHWNVAILSTNMLHEDYITIYLQGNNQGCFNLEIPHIHKNYGYITYGENFFEIRDYLDNFIEDIKYVKLVKKNVMSKYNLNMFYAIGHSNGGVFVTLLPFYLPGEFKALISHQGGMGYDEWFNIPFEKITNTEPTKPTDLKSPPIYFYTGTHDIHKIPCIQAHQLFLNEGFDSTIFIEENVSHTWNKSCEPRLFKYLSNY